MVETREKGHETFPPSPVIRQIPFSVSRSFTIADPYNFLRLFVYRKRYTHGHKEWRRFERAIRANVNFHLDDSISPPTRLDVSRAIHWFPATFLGNRTRRSS